MAEKREIISCALFGGQALFIRRLWDPETTDYKTGKPLDKPRYSVTARFPKTKAKWTDEPAFASVREASLKIYQEHFRGRPVESLIWPVKDGDRPSGTGSVSSWGAGHWWVRADTSSADYLTIEAVQNGKTIDLPAQKLGGRSVVKDGDLCILMVGIAKSEGVAPGLKTYLNGIVFTAPGEEVVLGSKPDTAALIEQARAQGLDVRGLGGAPLGAATSAPIDEDNPF